MNGFPVLPIAVGAAIVTVAPLRRRALATGTAIASAGVVALSARGVGDMVRAAVTGVGQRPTSGGS